MFKGIYTPMVTFFREDNSIDLEKNFELIDKLIEEKVNGIVILGSIGEFFNMSLNQKKEYLEQVAKHVRNRTQIFVGSGGNNLEEVIELTKYAEELKYNGALIISPYFFTITQEEAYEYYSKILKVTKIPILLYNFPDRTGMSLSCDTVKKLAENYSNIVGIKDSTNSFENTRFYITEVKEKLEREFVVLSGFDEYLILNLMSGGDGVICGLSNINPNLFVNTYLNFKDSNFKNLKENQLIINKLMKLYKVSSPFILAIKKAIDFKNDNYKLKNSTRKLNDLQLEEIKEILC